MKDKCEKEPLPQPRTINMPSRDYQPSKAGMEAEYDMPGATTGTVRRAFFRPFNVKPEER